MAKAPRTTKAKAAAPAAADTPPAPAPAPTASSPAGNTGSAPAPAGDLTRVLVSSISVQGRRRAGQGFTREPVELHVSDATLELLEGDPQLLVEVSPA